MVAAPHLHFSQNAIYPFDARGIAKCPWHTAIFGVLDALTRGEKDGRRGHGKASIPPNGRICRVRCPITASVSSRK